MLNPADILWVELNLQAIALTDPEETNSICDSLIALQKGNEAQSARALQFAIFATSHSSAVAKTACDRAFGQQENSPALAVPKWSWATQDISPIATQLNFLL